MNDNQVMMKPESVKKRFSCLQVVGIALLVMIMTVIVTMIAVHAYLFPRPFEPVVLSPLEKQRLEEKLDRLDAPIASLSSSEQSRPESEESVDDFTADGRLQPLPYSEAGAKREVSFTEREVNAIIATNTDLADKVAVDLSNDLVSARLLVPLDPDFPFFGGKVIRARAGVEMAYREGRPVVVLRGISLMGVPLPNAWLGGMKNIDLVREFSGNEGMWKAFADGVDSITVSEGEILVRLKE